MENKGVFLTLWLYLWNNWIKNSVIYRILCRIYGFFSEKWQSSFLANLFRNGFCSGDFAKNSIIGRILFSPFTLIEFIGRKFGAKLSFQKDHSFIIRTCKYYLHNILALNLRFLGVLVATVSATSLCVSLILGGSIRMELLGLVLGAVLIPFKVHLTDILKDSFFVGLAEKALGTKFSFDFYYVTKCGGKKSYICAIFFGVLAGLVSGFLSPLYGLLLLGGLLFFFLVLYKVRFGVYITLFLAPILPTMLVVGLCLLCLAALIIDAVTTKKFVFRREGLGLMLIILLCVYLVAAVTSFAAANSVKIWLVYFAFMVFYFVVINTVKTKKQLFDLLTLFSLSGLVVCLFGIMQYVLGWNVSQAWTDEEMFTDIKMRIYSTLENPNVLGEYILLVLPVTIGLMWKKKGIFTKIIYGGMAAVMGLALILTFSRGCWIGIIAAAGVFVTFAAGKLWGLALIVLPIIPMILPQSIINRFTSIGDMSDSSTSYRVYIWMGTLLLLKDFWLSGIGPGPEAFNQVYPFYSYSAVVAPHSHNLFLQIWVESGIVGVLSFLILLVVFVRKLAQSSKFGGKHSELSVTMIAIGAALVGFLMQGMFDNCFYNYRVFMIFWSTLALGISAANLAKEEME